MNTPRPVRLPGSKAPRVRHAPDRPAAERCVFVGGAARSGTTYVQLLLYAAGVFATAQETHLFPAFLRYLDESWQRLEDSAPNHRNVGLPAIMPRSEFDRILRNAAIRVLEIIARNKPEARWILEKTPGNVLYWPLIVRLLPKARFITVIRDPRAVVASTIAARGWAGHWAQRGAAQITEGWMKSVGACLALEAGHPHVTRVRYEDLLADGPGLLIGLLAKFNTKVSPRWAEHLVDSVSLDALRQGRVKAPWSLAVEPDGFFRSGDDTAWRKELPIATIALIEELARDEMRVLGYAPEVRLGSQA